MKFCFNKEIWAFPYRPTISNISPKFFDMTFYITKTVLVFRIFGGNNIYECRVC